MTPEELVQHRIRTLVISLQQLRGPKKIDLANTLGIDAATLSHRLSGYAPFRAHEVALLALHYELPTDAFLLQGPARMAALEGLGIGEPPKR